MMPPAGRFLDSLVGIGAAPLQGGLVLDLGVPGSNPAGGTLEIMVSNFKKKQSTQHPQNTQRQKNNIFSLYQQTELSEI